MQTKTVVKIIGVVVIVGILVAIAMWDVPDHTRIPSQQNACINNLRQIDGAKDQWAIEHGKTNGPVNEIEVNEYIKVAPSCPMKGTYTYGVIGVNPTCSLSTLTEGPHLLR